MFGCDEKNTYRSDVAALLISRRLNIYPLQLLLRYLTLKPCFCIVWSWSVSAWTRAVVRDSEETTVLWSWFWQPVGCSIMPHDRWVNKYIVQTESIHLSSPNCLISARNTHTHTHTHTRTHTHIYIYSCTLSIILINESYIIIYTNTVNIKSLHTPVKMPGFCDVKK